MAFGSTSLGQILSISMCMLNFIKISSWLKSYKQFSQTDLARTHNFTNWFGTDTDHGQLTQKLKEQEFSFLPMIRSFIKLSCTVQDNGQFSQTDLSRTHTAFRRLVWHGRTDTQGNYSVHSESRPQPGRAMYKYWYSCITMYTCRH